MVEVVECIICKARHQADDVGVTYALVPSTRHHGMVNKWSYACCTHTGVEKHMDVAETIFAMHIYETLA